MSRGFVMSLAVWLIAAFCPAAAVTTNETPAVQPFRADSLGAKTARRCGKGPQVNALGSVDCAYCKDGLAALEKLRRQRQDMRLVLIQADDDQGAAGAGLLKQFGVAGSEQWVFADAVPERLRYAIDRDWHGELPRAYLYGPDCQRTAVSGAVKPEQLRDWLSRFR